MVPLPEVELSFVLAAQRHLVPGLRPVFAERLASGLAAHADPGPGTEPAPPQRTLTRAVTPLGV